MAGCHLYCCITFLCFYKNILERKFVKANKLKATPMYRGGIFLKTTIIIGLFIFSGTYISIANAAYKEKLKGLNFYNDFSIGPAQTKLVIKRGQEVTKEIQVTNRGKYFPFIVETAIFKGSNNPAMGAIYYFDKDYGSFANSWLKPEIKLFSLKHGERLHFKVRIKVPDKADAGEHYAGVFIRNLPKKAKKKAIQISSRVGSLFLITISGKVKEEGIFSSFNSNKSLYEKGPVNFKLVVKNKGTVHLEPSGEIIIKKGRKLIDKIPVRKWFVLRESSRQQEVKWSKPLLIGKYTAFANVVLSNGKQETKKIVFYIIPIKSITIGILFILLFILGLYYFYKDVLSKYKILIQKK